jgi:Na+-transporting methylmalonyl-CoA/oxaloacetate decarboxylase gamma subunit
MLSVEETSTAATLLEGFLGVAVVVATLVFLVGVCGANAWLVRRVEALRTRKPAPAPPAAPPAPAPTAAATAPDHLLAVLTAAAAHALEEDVERVVILDVQAISNWQLEGRLAIHRNRLTGRPMFIPAFPAAAGGKSK